MPIFRTDNPDRDFDRWDRQREKALAKLPRCSECDKPIQDDFCYEINGELICEECLNDNHRKRVEDYAE